MSNHDTETTVCSNPECQVAETGDCLDGFHVNACPRYAGNPDNESSLPAVSDATVDAGVAYTQLMSADALTPPQASQLMWESEVRVVAILGPLNSGKTSLIASLYDLFQEAPVSDVEFSRSRTLHAFERACHDARSASRRREPDMSRTPRGGVRFYHLEVGGGPVGATLSLLMGDRSGEEYMDAADDASIACNFSEVIRADSLTLLIDGERLLDTGARHNLRGDVLLMLQALHDGGALRVGSRLAIVLTKLDAVRESPHTERVYRDFDALLLLLRDRFGDTFSVIEPFRTAALPQTDVLKRGTGVAELLSFWLKPAATPIPAARPIPSCGRDFARLIPLDDTHGVTNE